MRLCAQCFACLLVCACPPQRPVAKPPHGNASKAFHRRRVTHPSRATRGRLSPEHYGVRSAARSIAPSVSNSAESEKEV